MPAESGGWNQDEIMASVLAPKGKGHAHCWAYYMPDFVKETIALLDEVAEDDPSRINKAAFRRKLIELVGDEAPSREAVGRHFRGDCACQLKD